MSMSTASAGSAPIDPGNHVLELVDFKWLMAGEGHRIDVERLQLDRSYARGCLSLAAGSTCAALREAAQRIRAWIEPSAPTA